jgi:hypothetical protein
MAPAPDDHHCLEFARHTAAHHAGSGALHDDNERAHEIYQSSTLTARLDAVYDGGLTYAELEEHGDFGLGTFNALDGEMVHRRRVFHSMRTVPPPRCNPTSARRSCGGVLPGRRAGRARRPVTRAEARRCSTTGCRRTTSSTGSLDGASAR